MDELAVTETLDLFNPAPYLSAAERPRPPRLLHNSLGVWGPSNGGATHRFPVTHLRSERKHGVTRLAAPVPENARVLCVEELLSAAVVSCCCHFSCFHSLSLSLLSLPAVPARPLQPGVTRTCSGFR